jgi:hypothetical protein
MNDLQEQIQYVLPRYLNRSISFETFEDWFVDATWDVRKSNPEASDLVYAIEACIFDYTSHRKSERQLRASLRQFAPRWSWPDLAAASLSIRQPKSPARAKGATTALVVPVGT